MRILLIGATGTIGRAVTTALEPDHEVVPASRTSTVHVDLRDPDSIATAITTTGPLDAVIVAAAHGPLTPARHATAETYRHAATAKLDGQIHVLSVAARTMRPGGRVILTTGQFDLTTPGAATGASLNAALETYVRVAAHELPDLVVNVISPGWIHETLINLNQDPTQGIPAETVAHMYIQALTTDQTGHTFTATPRTP